MWGASVFIDIVALVMRSPEDAAHFAVVAVVGGVSAAANALLIVALILRTPRVLNSYSVLLLNTGGVDFCAALLNIAMGLRVQSIDGIMYFIYAGPCTHFGAHLCHRALALYTLLFAHSNVLLLFSYIYRWWILGRSSLTSAGPPQIRGRMWLLTLSSIAPSLVTMVASTSFAVYNDCPHESVCSAYPLAPHGIMSAKTSGTVTFLIGSYSLSAICFLIVRRALIRRIQALNSPERVRHQMVCNSLTAQAFLPLSGVAAAGTWALDFFHIVQSDWLQRSVVLMSSAFALFSPLIILYFLKPYRRFVLDLLGKKKISTITPGDNK